MPPAARSLLVLLLAGLAVAAILAAPRDPQGVPWTPAPAEVLAPSARGPHGPGAPAP